MLGPAAAATGRADDASNDDDAAPVEAATDHALGGADWLDLSGNLWMKASA